MNCCDDFGNCRQGRDCPVRIERLRKVAERHHPDLEAYRRALVLRLVLIVAVVGAVWIGHIVKAGS